jgi:hypothetical protein
MDCTFRKNCRKSFHVNWFPADSGAAETYTADWRKMAVSPQEKTTSVMWYWETKSIIQVQRRYRRDYGEKAPGRQSIKRWFKPFQETGSVLLKKGAGRPSVDADTVEMIHEAVHRSPSKSTSRVCRGRQVPRSTVQKILRRRLKLHAFRIRIVQALEPDDRLRREEFAVDMLVRIDQDHGFLEGVIFSDESTFRVCDGINRNNCRIWGSESPHAVREYERAIPKLNVGAHFLIMRWLDPSSIKRRPRANSTHYLDMLE